MDNYLQFDFDITASEDAEKLIALLSEQDFEGFEETDGHLTAFIQVAKLDEKEFQEIINMFPVLSYVRSEVENINWNQEWEAGFQPVIVEDKVAIRAGFHQPITNVEHEIIITPKMSFGTGHHATTYMMIQLVYGVDLTNKTVIDFGTGTGVLAILAEKLGASDILAIDYDEWSIENAKENLSQNNCSKIAIQQGDVFPLGKTYDIILANITLNVITANIAAMSRSCKKGAKAFFSGFLKADEANLTEILKQHEFQVVEVLQRGDWLAILAEKY